MSLRMNSILIRYGEIALKGKNQHHFFRCLKRNLKRKLKSLGLKWPVHRPYGSYYIDVPVGAGEPLTSVLDALAEMAGIAWYAPAHRIPAETVQFVEAEPDYKLIEARMTELARERDGAAGGTFCVRVNRGDKRFPLISPDMERRLGSAIIQNTGWNQVDLNDPDQTFYVDIQPEGIYLHDTRLEGMGGLPVGSTGRVLTLLSGGIDSPVAAYLAAKRGCAMDFLHFAATPIQPKQAHHYKVSRLVQHLSKFTLFSRLYLVPYTHFEFAVLGDQMQYELIIFRRFMTRVAEQLAPHLGAQALVTGDNVGQVASQTLENLVSNSQAVMLPILRPLLTYDKLEIVDLAKRLGTYQISLEPYKDCCSILEQHPKTKSEHRSISEREAAFLPNYDTLIRRTLDEALCLKYVSGRLANKRFPTFDKSAQEIREQVSA